MTTSQVIVTSTIVSVLIIAAMVGTVKMVSAHTAFGASQHSGFMPAHFFKHSSWQDAERLTHFKETCHKRGRDKIDHMIGFVEDRFDFTETQLEKWHTVINAMQAEQQTLDTVCDKIFTKENHATTPARLELAQTLMSTGVDALQRLQPTITDFYNSLDVKQQRTLDDLMGRQHHRHYKEK